jgi:hypothetical protein
MSYCRWSSNDFCCDLYVYEGDDGIVIHVASRRILGDVPKLDWASAETLYSTYKKQDEFMQTAQREDIGLSQDGESFYGLSHVAAISLLEMLRDEGYKFPYDVIECLMEELNGEA